ncbi:MAG: lecithin retinol acyltransferase family protein [Oscillospiraceae bacterium]|nr:lecithin retinol acyltransferase family protein [Oscillospiraceae bacterium]
MEFWDALSRGMDRLATKLDELSDTSSVTADDASFSVMDKDYCWEDLDYTADYTLQKHVVQGTCRIVDKYGTILGCGTQPQMEQKMMLLSERTPAMHASVPGISGDPFFAPASTDKMRMNMMQSYVPVQAQYGDIIGVDRKGGAYAHYGIYISDTCVVHYGIPASKTIGHAEIHCTDLKNFLKNDTQYFILDFPKPYQPPVRLDGTNAVPPSNKFSEELARTLQQTYGYHLYTPEETVARARSRIGETDYNLLTNNCEHFAIWCKTGVNESIQVSSMLNSLLQNSKWTLRKIISRN